MILLEWLLLLAGVGCLSLTETFNPLSAAGLGLLGLSWIVRLLRVRRVDPPSGLEGPWLLFLASAAYAAWIAYDPGAAWLQFARLLAAAALFYAVLANRRPRPAIASGTAPDLSLRGSTPDPSLQDSTPNLSLRGSTPDPSLRGSESDPLSLRGSAATVAISESNEKIATPGKSIRARNDMQTDPATDLSMQGSAPDLQDSTPDLSLRGSESDALSLRGSAATVAISESTEKIATPGETLRARNDMQTDPATDLSMQDSTPDLRGSAPDLSLRGSAATVAISEPNEKIATPGKSIRARNDMQTDPAPALSMQDSAPDLRGSTPALSLRGSAATVAISESTEKIATPGETLRARNDRQAGYPLLLAAGFVLAAAVLAIYWVSQADFALVNDKFVLLGRVGSTLQHLLPRLPGPSIHPNIAAGSLVLALPFAWEAARQLLAPTASLGMARRFRLALGGLMVVCALLILSGLALSASRGAALALAVVSALCGLIAIQRRRFSSPASARLFWGAGLLLALAAGAWLTVSGRLVQLVGQAPDPTGSLHLRTWLWQQGLRLAQDYAFTGSGLMSFWMVNSAYSMLIGVPYIAHVHNSFLEVWIEQGLAGGIALLWAGGVLLARLRRSLSSPPARRDANAWMWVGMAAIAIAFFHGLVDVVFYVSRTLPLLGFVLAFAMLPPTQTAPAGRAAAKGRRWALPALGLLALLALVLFSKPLRAAWLANRGARIQTTLELRAYDATRWDSHSLRDVRQELDLSPAMAAFEQALALDPHNRTALQRLALIALARNEVESAHAVTAQLWQDGRRDETTRLLASDARLLRGEIDAAVAAARDLTWAVPRLQGHAWYDCYTRGDYACAITAWQALQQLEPEKSAAYADQIEQARSRMKEGNP